MEGGGFVAIESVTIGPRIEYFAHGGVEDEGGFEVCHGFFAAFHALVEPAPIEVGGIHIGVLSYGYAVVYECRIGFAGHVVEVAEVAVYLGEVGLAGYGTAKTKSRGIEVLGDGIGDGKTEVGVGITFFVVEGKRFVVIAFSLRE